MTDSTRQIRPAEEERENNDISATSEGKKREEQNTIKESSSNEAKNGSESEVEANLIADEQTLAKTLEDSTKPKSEETGIKKDEKETVEDVEKLLAQVQEQIKTNKEKIPMTEHDMKSFVDWCLGGNRFLANNDENDLPKTESTDQMASELSSWVFGRLAGTGVGMALISTGVLSWLGILIIAYSNTPNSVATSLKKYIGGETFGLIPLNKIPNFSEKLAGYANGTNVRVTKKLKDLKETRANDLKNLEEQKGDLEKRLKAAQMRETEKAKTNESKLTDKEETKVNGEEQQEKNSPDLPESEHKQKLPPLSTCGSGVSSAKKKTKFVEDIAKKNGVSPTKDTGPRR